MSSILYPVLLRLGKLRFVLNWLTFHIYDPNYLRLTISSSYLLQDIPKLTTYLLIHRSKNIGIFLFSIISLQLLGESALSAIYPDRPTINAQLISWKTHNAVLKFPHSYNHILRKNLPKINVFIRSTPAPTISFSIIWIYDAFEFFNSFAYGSRLPSDLFLSYIIPQAGYLNILTH